MEGQPEMIGVERMVEALNDRGIGPRVWHDGLTETYFAVTDAKSYAEAFRTLNYVNIVLHQENGVLILDPERTVIEDGVTIEAVPLYKFLLELESGKYGAAY